MRSPTKSSLRAAWEAISHRKLVRDIGHSHDDLTFGMPLFQPGYGLVHALERVDAVEDRPERLRVNEPGKFGQVKLLWSLFVRRSELITGLYEAVAVPCLVGLLTGTPWIAPILRLLGARIGRRVWLDTTYLTEFDLVKIADDAAVGEMTSLQTHLFEDWVMKMAPVKIGAASSIGSRSVVLYNAEVEAGASLDSLSLITKGEVLPAGSHWRRIPACSTSREREARSALAMAREARV